MSATEGTVCRYFQSYSGVKLPLKLVNPLDEGDLENRNTFMRAYFDGQDRMMGCDKLVYGDIQISHRYAYHPNGVLSRAEITMDDEVSVLEFGEDGTPRRG
ncbi:hypothetical protein CU669_17060 [Paramagnetospirillum kuznetsovii]|uniref:Uncharacterized protein n=1 Tax=Paramagnetospirillum kuznetsovii TaxID=2053833 RepID=A0A364NUB7_9PROT|nr:DUF6156 family protein [Paramagnetospirillum kuznetsovii]RAU20652.1 hypothetical protein CU669_17060 [Paramagnetospirillum kuznetsovii]